MFLDCTWLPENEDRALIRDIEQVLVIGYPSALWDSFNNMPIARVGSTATHPLAQYQGNRDFLIDVAAFPGSSGSPVFTYEAPMFRQGNGVYAPGVKVQFIGVVWGVVEEDVTGDLRSVEIPSAFKDVPVVKRSLNLALALHSDLMLDIDELVVPGVRKLRAATRSAQVP